MNAIDSLRKELKEGGLARKLAWLYGCKEEQTDRYAQRYLHVLDGLEGEFGCRKEAALFSAPGRTEIGGTIPTTSTAECWRAASISI